MLCKIADLITEVPEAEGLALRCQPYLCQESCTPDIRICRESYRPDKRDPRMTDNSFAYMESAYQFYLKLVEFNGFYLHSSAVVMDGKAYLFSGPCCVGKSTHTRLWQQTFGPSARVINDDKPALRRVDGVWYAYGTPWCGKDGINLNEKAPIAGICFLKQAGENKITRLDKKEAMRRILSQTIHKFDNQSQLTQLLVSLEYFLREIPVFQLENLPEPAAAQLSYHTMCREAQIIDYENKE